MNNEIQEMINCSSVKIVFKNGERINLKCDSFTVVICDDRITKIDIDNIIDNQEIPCFINYSDIMYITYRKDIDG